MFLTTCIDEIIFELTESQGPFNRFLVKKEIFKGLLKDFRLDNFIIHNYNYSYVIDNTSNQK